MMLLVRRLQLNLLRDGFRTLTRRHNDAFAFSRGSSRELVYGPTLE
jgi:hypothetical protein